MPIHDGRATKKTAGITTDLPGAWAFRGAQVDLARQMETLEYMRGFTDFIAEHGYNVLVLYLEGRIRTPSFPYPGNDESYSINEMKEIVRYAAERRVDVVPIFENLGHAGQFLQYPELAHLDELRDGCRGRLASTTYCVCPSLKETYEFFGAYFAEVSEVFPSPYFFVANDEAFDLGFCELCRARAEDGEGQAGIFARHLVDTHAIVSGKLGKRLIVTDDLFEHYPEALERIPRDIVLCCWQYEGNVSLPVAHFKNRARWDLLAEYKRRGFEYMVASRDLNWRNTATLTQYAVRHGPLGGILTSWERSRDFPHACYPTVAFAGRLWLEPGAADDPRPLLDDVAARLFPGANSAVGDAVWDTLGLGRFEVAGDVRGFLRESPAGRRTERLLTNRMLTATLEQYQAGPDASLAAQIIDDLLIVIGEERLQLELSGLVPRVYDTVARGESPASLASGLRDCLQQANRLHEDRKRQWRKHRPGVPSTGNELDTYWTSFRRNLADFAHAAASGGLDRAGLLTIEYFLPDSFSQQLVCIAVKHLDGKEWREVGRDIPKPLFFNGEDERDHSGYVRVSYPIQAGRGIAQCRIETCGYGGIGIRQVEFRGPSGTCMPRSIVAASDMVTQPHRVLDSSSIWCWLGEPDTGLAYRNPGMASIRHSLIVQF